MATPKRAPLKPLQIGFIVLGVIILGGAASIGIRMLQPWITSLQTNHSMGMAVAPESYGGGMADMAQTSSLKVADTAPSVSRGIIAPIPPVTTPVPGNNAEDFEVTSYTTTIETKTLTDTCGKFTALKAKDYIIFENADENERNCTYTFKVSNKNIEEVLSLIKSLDPKTLNENTYTIKRILENIESQEDVLKKKADSIETTLKDAIDSYDEIAKLARSTKDTESLTKLMNSKIDLIQRLTNERLQNNAQLEQIARDKVDQADQLVYTNFQVSIIEDTFLNGRDIRDSWNQAVKDFVTDLNAIAQAITVGLVTLLFVAVQYAIYFVILLFLAKYGWKFTKYVWKK